VNTTGDGWTEADQRAMLTSDFCLLILLVPGRNNLWGVTPIHYPLSNLSTQVRCTILYN